MSLEGGGTSIKDEPRAHIEGEGKPMGKRARGSGAMLFLLAHCRSQSTGTMDHAGDYVTLCVAIPMRSFPVPLPARQLRVAVGTSSPSGKSLFSPSRPGRQSVRSRRDRDILNLGRPVICWVGLLVARRFPARGDRTSPPPKVKT